MSNPRGAVRTAHRPPLFSPVLFRSCSTPIVIVQTIAFHLFFCHVNYFCDICIFISIHIIYHL